MPINIVYDGGIAPKKALREVKNINPAMWLCTPDNCEVSYKKVEKNLPILTNFMTQSDKHRDARRRLREKLDARRASKPRET